MKSPVGVVRQVTTLCLLGPYMTAVYINRKFKKVNYEERIALGEWWKEGSGDERGGREHKGKGQSPILEVNQS